MRALKRLNAWINDAALRDVSSKLYIVDIHEQPADTTMEWGSVPGVSGQRLLHRTRQSVRIQIEFDIRELFNLAERAAIVTAANEWAKDGVLKVSYRPDQMLAVILAEAASIEDARDVSSTFTITFQAGVDPYWRDEHATVYSYTGAAASQEEIMVPGQAMVSPEITITPAAAMDALAVALSGQVMYFTGLSVPAGTALRIDHDERGLLRIRANGISKLACRTATSVDDFLMAPGRQVFAYTADGSCAVQLAFRGRYL
jgi:hypothetical protein